MTDDIEKSLRALDLDATASLNDVKRAWRESAKFYHPDRLENDPKLQQRGQEKLKKINAAYETLKEYFASGGHSQPQAEPPPKPRYSEPQTPPPGAKSYSRPKPPPAASHSEQSSSEVYLSMTCFRCQGSIKFPKAREGEFSTCPHCGRAIQFSRRTKNEYTQNPQPKPNYSQPKPPSPTTSNKNNQSKKSSDDNSGGLFWLVMLFAMSVFLISVAVWGWNSTWHSIGSTMEDRWWLYVPMAIWGIINSFLGNRSEKGQSYKETPLFAKVVIWALVIMIVVFGSIAIYYLFR